MYLYLGQPEEWKVENEVIIYGTSLAPGDKLIRPDAEFKRDGKYHFLEVDRTQSMSENKKKLELYAELDVAILNQFRYRPTLIFYTTTTHRRDTLKTQCQQLKLNCEIYCKEDLK